MQIDFANDDVACEKNERSNRNIVQFQLILTIFDSSRLNYRESSQRYVDAFVQLFR